METYYDYVLKTSATLAEVKQRLENGDEEKSYRIRTSPPTYCGESISPLAIRED